MNHCTSFLKILLACFSFGLLSVGTINSAYGEPNTALDRIHGKVTDIINASGYTYAEVDTGEKKVWAAGPVTPLKKGDMIAFSTEMPMKNFHSNSMNRDFSIVYFVNRFITDKETPATGSPHGKIKPKQMTEPAPGINKVKNGNTIAEIYSQKNSLGGKTVRVRGQVTRYTAEVMGKNWIHIKDSSTLDDLTATINSIVAIGDIVVIEGKLELDKDYGYGYIYPLIVEDAKITKE